MTEQIEQLLEKACESSDEEFIPGLGSIKHQMEDLRQENEQLREERAALQTELDKTTQGTLQLASELEEQYQHLFESAEEGIYRLSVSVDQYTMANPAFAELLGYDSGDDLCTAIENIEDDVFVDSDRYKTFIERLSSAGELDQFEYRVQTVEGDIRWVSDSVTALTDTDGNVTGYRGGVIDVTERKEAIKELREHMSKVTQLHEIATDIADADSESEIYQRTVDGATDIFPCDGAYIAVPAEEDLVPAASSRDGSQEKESSIPPTDTFARRVYRSDDVLRVDTIGTRSSSDADTSDPPPSQSVDSTKTRQNFTQQDDYRALVGVSLEDEGLIQLHASEPGAFDDRDEDLLDLLANHVITTLYRVRAETTLRRERDRLDEFASVISHDLRNPLNVATGRTTLAGKECNSEHLDEVEAALNRMETIIEDVLELSRQGESVGETQIVDLAMAVRDAWESVSTPQATLETGSLGQVQADRSRLVTVFENLFRNAIEHGSENVTVTVGQLDAGFYVEDSGPGIPPSERNQIFESGYTTNSQGTGFGLAIVKQIVTAHRWDIDVTEGADGGARFEITGRERTPLIDTTSND